MKKLNTLTIGLGLSCLALACVINDDDGGGGVDTETSGTAGTMTTMTTTTMTTTAMTMTTDDTTGGMTMGQTDDTTATTGPGTDGSSSSTALDPGPFVGEDPDPSLYTQVDRIGQPAVNTALIATDNKDTYNSSDPSDDTSNTFVPDINASVTFLVGSLSDDITGAGATPCPNANQCLTQTLPVVIPDTLRLDLNTAAGFPNGRLLADQVIDLTLAVLLLDLSPPPDQPLSTLADLPVNPPQNDVAFEKTFPFLAPAH